MNLCEPESRSPGQPGLHSEDLFQENKIVCKISEWKATFYNSSKAQTQGQMLDFIKTENDGTKGDSRNPAPGGAMDKAGPTEHIAGKRTLVQNNGVTSNS